MNIQLLLTLDLQVDLLEWFYTRLAGSLKASAYADEEFDWSVDDNTKALEDTVYNFDHSDVRESLAEERRALPSEHECSTLLMHGRHGNHSQASSSESLSKLSRMLLTDSSSAESFGLREDPPPFPAPGSQSRKMCGEGSKKTPVQHTDNLLPYIPPIPEQNDKGKKKEKKKRFPFTRKL